jgi:hypothetical protein
MLKVIVTSAILALAPFGTLAKEKPTRFWNLTRSAVKNLQMSPAGKEAWGRNLCEGDKDGEVDHDERLAIEGLSSGRYDIKLTDNMGRTCIVENIAVEQGAVFPIEEKQLTNCAQ